MNHATAAGNANKLMVYLIGGFTIISIGMLIILSIRQNKRGNVPAAATYAPTDSERPKAVTAATFADLGAMKVKDEKTAEFTIENAGSKPLIVSNISSSCGCTVGRITIDGTTSPEFSMHAKGTWQGTVQPGKKAAVTVIYRPYIMPVIGMVTRNVYVQTNDPEHRNLTFSVKATVQ